MAAFADLVTLDTGTWKAISSGSTTSACVMNLGPYDIEVQCTSGGAPTDEKGMKRLAPGAGFDGSVTPAILWPHIASSWTLWARCVSPTITTTKVSVSHA